MGLDDLDSKTLLKTAKVLDAENRKLIDEVRALKRRVRELAGKEPVQLALEVQELERQLALRNKMIFGRSSEKRPHSGGDGDAPKTPQTGHGPTEQVELQSITRVHERSESDESTCAQCGGQLHAWDGQFEDAEEVDVIERRYVRVLHRRQKYRCSCGACIETASAPPRVIPGGRYSVGFIVHAGIAKYADHSPLERQVRTMKRHGLQVTSQTLWDQLNALAKLLEPLYRRVRAYLLSKAVLGADETHWPVLDGAKERWQVWALCADDAVYYQIEDSRSAQAAAELLGDYAGKLMVDGYSGYQALKKRGGKFELLHCWAHVRRKYVEVEDLHPGSCTEVLDLIGQLYEVERITRDGPDDERARLRRERSADIVKRIHDWALAQRALPQSPLGKAIAYMGALWDGLGRFLHDPALPIDNNAVERALRGVVVGRKNHYGSKSKRGTEVAALLYSLIESAKLAGVDPHAYLCAAADAALRGVQPPLPHEFVAG